MARKVAIQYDANVREALEDFKTLTELRYEIAKEAYDFQDADTKKVIDRIRQRLALGASGYIKVQVNPPHGSYVPVKIDGNLLDANVLYVAVEILKDLALFDVRIENYSFPPTSCVGCGAELSKGKKRG